MILGSLLAHAWWADRLMFSTLGSRAEVAPEALRELNHIVGAGEVWLSRLERRPSRAGVWPDLSIAEASTLAESVHARYRDYGTDRDPAALTALVRYTNSAGQSFETPVGEILMHMALHSQYHRGKINLILRQTGQAPVPTDYIAFQRGVPAAITPPRSG
jgi:uncharacterized damage-inducible protein DinB